MAKISRTDKIREIVRLEKTIIEDFQQKQLIWYGHVERIPEHTD